MRRMVLAMVSIASMLCVASQKAAGYTANKVWIEFWPSGIHRVHVIYTVPELKELRASYVEFKKKQDAVTFYWDLVKGADFFPPRPESRRFINQPAEPQPW